MVKIISNYWPLINTVMIALVGALNAYFTRKRTNPS
jgi:hypothetical protein